VNVWAKEILSRSGREVAIHDKEDKFPNILISQDIPPYSLQNKPFKFIFTYQAAIAGFFTLLLMLCTLIVEILS